MAHFIKRIFPFFKIDFIFHVKQKKLNIFVIYLTNFGQDTTCVLSAIDIVWWELFWKLVELTRNDPINIAVLTFKCHSITS